VRNIRGDSRDRSELANHHFQQSVPSEPLLYLRKRQGMHPEFEKRWPQLGKVDLEAKLSWSEVFGHGAAAEEMFMAYALGTYVGKVAEAGKEAYPIPMFTNVWLNTGDEYVLDVGGIPSDSLPIVAGGGSKPGVYPSGGPCPHTLDLWKCCAPALDFISPDIYLQDYEWVCKQYRYQNQPLFIPEQRADARGARRAWLAYGSYSALGCSPFGVDDIAASGNTFTKSYGILAKMSRHILAAQAANPEDVFGFFFDDDDQSPTGAKDACWTKTFAEFTVCVKRAFVFGKPGPGYGIVIHRGQGRFLLIGEGFEVSFGSIHSAAMYTGILEFTELNVDEHGTLLPNGRKLNGDERRGGEVAIMPAESPGYGGFPIRVTIPARTYVAECIVYTI
jgi:hypothetical protein